VTVMDQQQDFPAGVDQEWSFVYIPYSSINLIGGRVDDDGSLLNSVGSFTVNNTGTGMYEIAVPGKTDADGILLLTISKYATKGGVWGPDDNLLAYMYDPSANSGNGAFVIESVDLAGATPQNTEFVFAFIEYANPIFSGTASNPDPMNRAIHVDPTVVLSWDAPSDVGSPTYNVYIVENDPNFESVFPVAIDLAVTSYDPPGDLELNTTYYWRVDIYDPGEDVTYEGPVWAFAIGGMATDPYPADGAPGVRLNTELVWTGDENIATSYDVYLRTDPNVPTPSSFLGNVTETTYVDPPTGDELTTYYWRVDERDDQGVIAPGEIWSFATGGLLAHWAFDDGSGYLAADSSGNGFNGDISGAAWTDGVLGGALALDGIDDYVDFGALSEFEIANGTITGWFYVNSWPVRGGIISKDGSGYRDDFELMRDRSGSNKLHFEMHPIAAPRLTSVKSDDDIALVSWTHFAISWGSEGMKMWIDGVQQADTNPWTDGIVSSGYPLMIGTGQYGSFEGLVDEFRLFSGILNDSEIQAIFADSNIAKSPNPYNGEVDVPVEAELIWTAGKNAVTHEVYLRTDPNFASAVPVATGLTSPSYDPPGDLELNTTYYWCVDEVDSSANVTPGNIWSFTTVPPKAYNPAPTNSATEVDPGTVLSWTPGGGGTYQHDVYIGTDQTIVANATPADSEFKGAQPYEETDYDPDLNYGITYYWRIDEVDNGDTYRGDLWTFTTIVPVCDPPLPQDITGDCVVNLEDVASMAGAWLLCNRIPVDACPQ
ncbi:MAG: LamG-like jellyroll fold domain-containing protein, partial [Candidatus Neomarinimicrobiota bacterium]